MQHRWAKRSGHSQSISSALQNHSKVDLDQIEYKLNIRPNRKVHHLQSLCVLHPLPTNESYCEENIWANNSFWSLWVAPEVSWSTEFYIRTPTHKLPLLQISTSEPTHISPEAFVQDLYPSASGEAKPSGWKTSWKLRSEWFGRNWSYCEIFQDEPTGGLESSWWFNGLKKRMGLNLDHVLRWAAKDGGRVWQTCPDCRNCPLHIWITWKECCLPLFLVLKILKRWSKLPFCGWTLLHVLGFVPQGCPRVCLETSLGIWHLGSGIGEGKSCTALGQARHAGSSSSCRGCSGKASSGIAEISLARQCCKWGSCSGRSLRDGLVEGTQQYHGSGDKGTDC